MRYAFAITAAVVLMAVVFTLGLVHGKNSVATGAPETAGPVTARQNLMRSSYPGVMESSLGSNMKINGVPTSISSFETKNSSGEVLNYYTRLWQSRGLEVIRQTHLNYSTLGTFDLRERKFKGLLAFQNTGGRPTLVFPFTISLDERPRERRVYDIPGFDGVVETFHLECRDSGVDSDTIGYVVNGRVQHNMDYYLSRMAANGWQYSPVDAYPASAGAKALLFKKQGRECVVNIQDAGNGKSHVLINVVD